MKKNPGEIFESVQVDPISGDYYVIIPESVSNELSWYEDTEIQFKIEGDEVILTERTDWQTLYNELWYWSNRIKLWLKDLL